VPRRPHTVQHSHAIADFLSHSAGMCREIGIRQIHQQVDVLDQVSRRLSVLVVQSRAQRRARFADFAACCWPSQVELVRRDYTANGGWETFLAYEVRGDRLYYSIVCASLIVGRLRRCRIPSRTR
jgi:hypothetical protein